MRNISWLIFLSLITLPLQAKSKPVSVPFTTNSDGMVIVPAGLGGTISMHVIFDTDLQLSGKEAAGAQKEAQKMDVKDLSAVQKESEHTVMNSQQKDTNRVFGVFQRGAGHSPLLVKMALRNVVIVGDEIAYLQRLQVQGGSSQSGSPSGIAVTISPTAQNVVVGATQQFTATVTGGSNTAVTWSVDAIAGGNTTLGLYTAPANIPASNPVTVKATR